MLQRLKGLRIIVIEDEYLIAETLREDLLQAGAETVSIVPELEAARAATAGANPCDVVILDLKLMDGIAVDFAADLMARDIPVVFTTAYPPTVLDERHAGAPFFDKPFTFRAMLPVLADMPRRACGRSAARRGLIESKGRRISLVARRRA